MIKINDDRMETLLLQLIQDMAYVKSKLDNIEEQKLSSRIDKLEADVKEGQRTIKSLEHRNDEMEKFVRSNIIDSNKTSRSVFVSMALAVFSAVVSLVFNMI